MSSAKNSVNFTNCSMLAALFRASLTRSKNSLSSYSPSYCKRNSCSKYSNASKHHHCKWRRSWWPIVSAGGTMCCVQERLSINVESDKFVPCKTCIMGSNYWSDSCGNGNRYTSKCSSYNELHFIMFFFDCLAVNRLLRVVFRSLRCSFVVRLLGWSDVVSAMTVYPNP